MSLWLEPEGSRRKTGQGGWGDDDREAYPGLLRRDAEDRVARKAGLVWVVDRLSGSTRARIFGRDVDAVEEDEDGTALAGGWMPSEDTATFMRL